MGRKSLKETRQKEIVQVFYKLAKREGLENTSIAKIAKEMDINPSLIIHYFQTREDLTYALIDYILDKYRLIYQVKKKESKDPQTSLLEIIDNIFSKKWNTLFDDGLFYSCYALSFREPQIRDLYRKMLDSLRDLLCAKIEECVSHGLLDIQDPARVADNVFVLVDGAYFYLSLMTDKADYEERLARYKAQAVEMLNFVPAPSFGLRIPSFSNGPHAN
jgi:AcrR family transcriptional regulator